MGCEWEKTQRWGGDQVEMGRPAGEQNNMATRTGVRQWSRVLSLAVVMPEQIQQVFLYQPFVPFKRTKKGKGSIKLKLNPLSFAT